MHLRFAYLAISLWGATSAVAERTFEPSPFVTVNEFPTRTWDGRDAEELAAAGPFGAAAKALLEAGLPDPKGLPYHEVWLPSGECYTGDAGVVKTHGWLLPRQEGEPQFAIGWNGLVYEAVRVGNDLELAEVVRDLFKRENKNLFGPFGWSEGEAAELLPNAVDLVHAVYLARLEFPEALDDLLERRERAPAAGEATAAAAAEWTWNLYDRAVCAHMRGDARMVLTSLGELGRVRPAGQILVGKESGPDRWARQLDALVTDNEARLAAGKGRERFAEKEFLEGEPSVEELIVALEEIQVPQDGQPGDVMFMESPILRALVAKGNAAIEPLFEVLERDRRLTRSVHFWRSHYPSRTVLTVQEAALFAVENLLQVHVFELASTGDSFTARSEAQREEVVAAMRTSWEKYNRTVGPDRWYEMLKDDEAKVYVWARGAMALMKEEVYDEEKGEYVLPEGPLPGEPLRDRENPSVSDLLVKRIAQVREGAQDDRADPDTVERLMMDVLSKWDAPRATEVIDAYCARQIESEVWKREGAQEVARFAGQMLQASPKALELFDLMVRRAPAGELEETVGYSFLWFVDKNREREPMRRLVAWMLEGDDSPWQLGRFPVEELHPYVSTFIEAELLDMPVIRRAFLKGLRDETVCGEVRIKTDTDDGPRYEVVYAGKPHGASWPIRPEMEMGPKQGMPTEFRRCDVLADHVAYEWAWDGDKQHEFELYWPKERRDDEIAKWMERVAGWKREEEPAN